MITRRALLVGLATLPLTGLPTGGERVGDCEILGERKAFTGAGVRLTTTARYLPTGQACGAAVLITYDALGPETVAKARQLMRQVFRETRA